MAKEGKDTTEYKLTNRLSWLGVVVTMLGALLEGFAQIWPDRGNAPQWARLIMIIGGLMVPAIKQAVYTWSRTRVKQKNGALVLLVLLPIVALGCTPTMKRYDPNTVKNIKETIEFEQKDYEMTVEALEELGADEVVLKSAEVRHESEITRLQDWLLSEEAKKLEDEEDSDDEARAPEDEGEATDST